jgi:hypothetical protein
MVAPEITAAPPQIDPATIRSTPAIMRMYLTPLLHFGRVLRDIEELG